MDKWGRIGNVFKTSHYQVCLNMGILVLPYKLHASVFGMSFGQCMRCLCLDIGILPPPDQVPALSLVCPLANVVIS